MTNTDPLAAALAATFTPEQLDDLHRDAWRLSLPTHPAAADWGTLARAIARANLIHDNAEQGRRERPARAPSGRGPVPLCRPGCPANWRGPHSPDCPFSVRQDAPRVGSDRSQTREGRPLLSYSPGQPIAGWPSAASADVERYRSQTRESGPAVPGRVVAVSCPSCGDTFWPERPGSGERCRGCRYYDRPAEPADVERERPGRLSVETVDRIADDAMRGPRCARRRARTRRGGVTVAERPPSWRDVAYLLAHRLANHAYCPDHPESDPSDMCPFCDDRATYRLWQRKAARKRAAEHAGEE